MQSLIPLGHLDKSWSDTAGDGAVPRPKGDKRFGGTFEHFLEGWLHTVPFYRIEDKV